MTFSVIFLNHGIHHLENIFGLKKNDENDFIFSTSHHTDVTATHLKLKKHLIH